MSRHDGLLVFGATGHTGRFVVAELLRRGLVPVLCGRDLDRLDEVAAGHPDVDRHAVTGVDDPTFQRAVSGVRVVINCAGPFLDTALPLARAAVDAGAHYLDVSAEQPVVRQVYRELDEPARRAGVTVVPAMAFYGGLADLLATAVLGDGGSVDRVEVAVGLDSWWPTAGTRRTGERNTATRMVIRGGALRALPSRTETRTWAFPEPLGALEVVELPFSEVITIHRHLAVGELHCYLSTASLEELRDTSTPPPVAAGEDGRSTQRFAMDVVVGRGPGSRRIRAVGRDIYAVSAPIVVEGAVRLLDGRARRPGAAAPGQAFDAVEVLSALAEASPDLEIHRD